MTRRVDACHPNAVHERARSTDRGMSEPYAIGLRNAKCNDGSFLTRKPPLHRSCGFALDRLDRVTASQVVRGQRPNEYSDEEGQVENRLTDSPCARRRGSTRSYRQLQTPRHLVSLARSRMHPGGRFWRHGPSSETQEGQSRCDSLVSRKISSASTSVTSESLSDVTIAVSG